MRQMCCLAVVLLTIGTSNIIAAPPGFVAPHAPPSWIWHGPGGEKQTVFLRCTFEIKSPIKSAKLVIAADDRGRVFVDGQEVVTSESWAEPTYKDLTPALAPGRHTIAIWASNERSAAGILLRLTLESETGESFALLSDGSWLTTDKEQPGWTGPPFDDSKWSAARVLAGLGGKPWDRVKEQTLVLATRLKEPTATPADKIKVAKDFKVELLYSVPKDSQGSWVNLCTDPKGRLYVSDQYGPLYRITPPAVRGQESGVRSQGSGVRGQGKNGSSLTPDSRPLTPETKVERVPVELGEAQGLLWAFDSLYVVVNKGNKYECGLYRVRDTNGDDQLDEVKLLRKLEGGGEHGPHAVILAPDKKSLFVLCGNQTKMTELAGSRVPKHWGEDHLLPRMPDGRGFMAGVLGPGGCIYQVDPDGKDWVLFSTGFRNPFDIAFNRDGELFTYDADMEWDIGTPWYRPTRINHVTSGSEFGWRNGAGKWPAYYPDSLPGVVDIGPGSPTGICFGYGAKFPAKYQDALFICDWSYGKMYAVLLKEQGSSYTGDFEEFLSGNPLPLTDVVINPVDGAMYFAIGGRKTKSGLYRVTYAGSESTQPLPTPAVEAQGPVPHSGRLPMLDAKVDLVKKAPLPTKETRRARKWVEEKSHASSDFNRKALIEVTSDFLASDDRFLRAAARTAFEHVDPAIWRDQALSDHYPPTALAALLAIVRVSADDPQHHPKDARPVDEALKGRILDSLARFDWNKLDETQRIELLRIYEILFVRMGKPNDTQRQRVLSLLDPHYPNKSRNVNAMLCEIMVYLEAPDVVKRTLAMLAAAPTQEEQMEYAKSLRVLKTGWTPEKRKEYFGWFRKTGNFAGGMSFQGFLDIIKKDAVATLTPEEQVVLKPILEAPPDTTPVVAQPSRPFVKKWTVADLDSAIATKLKDRDFDRGRQIFGAANCFSCHRFANEGGSQGPDLTMAAGRFSPRDLLESIIEPSKEISDQYASVVINTIDGKMITGRIVNLDGNNLSILTNMLEPNKLTRVDVRRVETQDVSKVSMMPAGALECFKEDEILDLLAYLLSKGQRDGVMFKK